MLDNNDIARVCQLIAQVERDLHTPHGSYTHLCVARGAVLLAHQPVGTVLAVFEQKAAQP